MNVVDVTDDSGRVAEPLWLGRAEGVHRQLRTALPADYAGRLAQVFANGGRLAVAADGEAVVGVALWRLIENTYEGRRLYVDDLVTDASRRSRFPVCSPRCCSAFKPTIRSCSPPRPPS